MKLANIVPVSLLGTIPHEQTVHLVLSELILENGDYYKFYKDRRDHGDFVILDNPVHENRPVAIARWIEAVKLLMPNVAVIPDVIDSDADTVSNAMTALRKFDAMTTDGIELMAVPHGVSQSDWRNCAETLARFEKITYFGISLERRLKDDNWALARRRERVRMLLDDTVAFDRIKLHLLGISERGDELGDDYIWSRASSADASKYAVWNMLGTPVTPPVPVTKYYPGRGPFGGGYEYFTTDKPAVVSERRMRNNLRKWVNYAQREFL